MDVDSTLGFPNSGTLSYRFEDGTAGVCTYAHKTVNQFLGINTTGIGKTILDNTALDQDTFSYGSGAGSTDGIKVKVRAVLKDLVVPKKTYYQKAGSKVKLISLGKISKTIKDNNWLFNTAQSYVVEKLEIIDSINFLYKLTTKDKNILRIGDKVTTHLTVNNTVKWGSPNIANYLAGINYFVPRAAVVNNGPLGIYGHQLGVKAWVSHVPNFLPQHSWKVHDLMNYGDYPTAQKIFNDFNGEYSKIRAAISSQTAGEGIFVKPFMEYLGRPSGPSRLPSRNEVVTEEIKQKIKVLIDNTLKII